jgi:hypothetical protein
VNGLVAVVVGVVVYVQPHGKMQGDIVVVSVRDTDSVKSSVVEVRVADAVISGMVVKDVDSLVVVVVAVDVEISAAVVEVNATEGVPDSVPAVGRVLNVSTAVPVELVVDSVPVIGRVAKVSVV